MSAPETGDAPQLMAEYERLVTVRWEAYAVRVDGDVVGYLSRLPEGTWIAYRADGKLPGTHPTREAAAACLAAPRRAPLSVPAAPTTLRRSGL